MTNQMTVQSLTLLLSRVQEAMGSDKFLNSMLECMTATSAVQLQNAENLFNMKYSRGSDTDNEKKAVNIRKKLDVFSAALFNAWKEIPTLHVELRVLNEIMSARKIKRTEMKAHQTEGITKNYLHSVEVRELAAKRRRTQERPLFTLLVPVQAPVQAPMHRGEDEEEGEDLGGAEQDRKDAEEDRKIGEEIAIAEQIAAAQRRKKEATEAVEAALKKKQDREARQAFETAAAIEAAAKIAKERREAEEKQRTDPLVEMLWRRIQQSCPPPLSKLFLKMLKTQPIDEVTEHFDAWYQFANKPSSVDIDVPIKPSSSVSADSDAEADALSQQLSNVDL